MTHTHSCCLGFALALAGSALAAPSTESWVHVGADGKLVYHADARGNRVPDFSNVGYRGGGVALRARILCGSCRSRSTAPRQ